MKQQFIQAGLVAGLALGLSACGKRAETAAAPVAAARGCRAIILGIDPSLRGTGLAVIDARAEPMRLLASVTLKLGPKLEPYECLGRIADAVERLAKEHAVTQAAIEETIEELDQIVHEANAQLRQLDS